MADSSEIPSESAPEPVANSEPQADAPVEAAPESIEQEAAPGVDAAEESDPVVDGSSEQAGTETASAEASQPKEESKQISSDDKDGLNKVFVGGITQETTDNDLKAYFEATFGKVLDITIMKDRLTGKSRGFGFITFETQAVADKVVASKHEINGKSVEAKPAVPRGSQSRGAPFMQDNSPKVNKIFVGGLSPDVNDEELKEYFSQFGTVVEATVVVDKDTNRKRGFGFVQFSSSDAVDSILNKREHSIKDKVVEVKKAFPKGTNPQNMTNRGGPPPMGRGMMGGNYGPPPGRGGYGGNGYGANGHQGYGGYGQQGGGYGGGGYYGGYDQSKGGYHGYGGQSYSQPAAPSYPAQPQASYGHDDGSMQGQMYASQAAPQQPAYSGYDQSGYGSYDQSAYSSGYNTGGYDASYSGGYGSGYAGYSDPSGGYGAQPAAQAGAARYHPYSR